jgi:hypothetical protein
LPRDFLVLIFIPDIQPRLPAAKGTRTVDERRFNMAPKPLECNPETTSDKEGSIEKDTDDIEDMPGTTSDVEKDAGQRKHTNNGEEGAMNRVPTAQDWNGPNDPENPQNWPFIRKAYQTAVVGFLAFA